MTTKPILTGSTAALLALFGTAPIGYALPLQSYPSAGLTVSEPYIGILHDDDEDDYITVISKQFDIEDDENDEDDD